MAKPSLDTIRMLPFGMLNAFLLTRAQDAILVDTGLPKSEASVLAALRRRGMDWSHLKLIIVTHAHIDHAGSAARLRALSAAPVMAHAHDVPSLQGQAQEFAATGPTGRFLKAVGLPQGKFDSLTPDLILSDHERDLSDFGFDAMVLHTPGHTAGSLSVLVDGGDVIAGDLVASGLFLGGIACRNRPKPPPFEADRDRAKASLRHLLARGGDRFHLGHGGPLSAERVRAYAG